MIFRLISFLVCFVLFSLSIFAQDVESKIVREIQVISSNSEIDEQDILNELFLDPVDLRTYAINELSLKQREQLEGYAIDHGIDIIGDERE